MQDFDLPRSQSLETEWMKWNGGEICWGICWWICCGLLFCHDLYTTWHQIKQSINQSINQSTKHSSGLDSESKPITILFFFFKIMFTTTVAWTVCGPVCHPLVNIFARSWLWWVAQIPARWPYSTLLRTKGTPAVLYSTKISTKDLWLKNWGALCHTLWWSLQCGFWRANRGFLRLRKLELLLDDATKHISTHEHTHFCWIYSPMVFRRKDAVPKDANKPNDIWVHVLRTGCTPIWVAQLSCSRPCAWSRREECWIMFSEQRWSWVSSVPLVIRLRSRRLCSDLNLENFGALQSTEIREVF